MTRYVLTVVGAGCRRRNSRSVLTAGFLVAGVRSESAAMTKYLGKRGIDADVVGAPTAVSALAILSVRPA